MSGTTVPAGSDRAATSNQEGWRWDGSQFVYGTVDSPGIGQVRRPPARKDRVLSGCAGLVLFFPFYLLLVFLVLPIRGLFGEAVTNFTVTFDGGPALYFLFVSLPLMLVFGQSFGQIMNGIYVLRWDPDRTAAPKRAGPLRAIAHVVLFVVLFPIDWLPWVVGRARMLHEVIAGTEVVVSPRPTEVHVTQRMWWTLVGGLYFGYTLLVFAAGWSDTRTYVAVAVMWAMAVGFALWLRTAERHPLFLTLSIGLTSIAAPAAAMWAVLTGKFELDAYYTGRLLEDSVLLIGFGLYLVYKTFRELAQRNADKGG